MFEIRSLDPPPSTERYAFSSGDRDRQVVPLVLAAQNENGKFIGGLFGNTFRGFALVQFVWFSTDTVREQCGTRLIEEFEHIASRRGCVIFFIEENLSTNAALYRESGYALVEGLPGFIRDDQPRGYLKQSGPMSVAGLEDRSHAAMLPVSSIGND